MTTTENLDALIARRDALKINIDSHLRFDKSTDAPGDQLRDELGQVIGKITEALHRPYKIESERLAETRAQLVQELTTANPRAHPAPVPPGGRSGRQEHHVGCR